MPRTDRGLLRLCRWFCATRVSGSAYDELDASWNSGKRHAQIKGCERANITDPSQYDIQLGLAGDVTMLSESPAAGHCLAVLLFKIVLVCMALVILHIWVFFLIPLYIVAVDKTLVAINATLSIISQWDESLRLFINVNDVCDRLEMLLRADAVLAGRSSPAKPHVPAT
ncbi:Uncharacterized protein PBTT_01404 [Plasmodiophora brassicae]|uniref:Uncharacterized protein n=1 Tax=Plasmodiophora brassicae TaxID=37360 RepID=A0A0G4II07_PLABS|nr:hypothetical protein PBRA_003627 [Plasmodiophora brassicae]